MSRRSLFRRKAGRKRQAGLLVLSLLVGFLAVEIAARVWYGPLPESLTDWSSIVLRSRTAVVPPALVADPTVGWAGAPNVKGDGVTHDARGFRIVPNRPIPGGASSPIVAAGDSFTYGAEVRDDESWPFYLQEMVGRRVINSGMPGYGLDQSVLRAEQLVKEFKPSLLIVSFIPDDLIRSEMSRAWQREKPWFELVGSDLKLRNVPVPPNAAPGSHVPFWERWIGWSVVVNTLRNHLVKEQEVYFGDHLRAMPEGDGEKVACALMQRLAGLKVPTLVVAQYSPIDWKRLHAGKPPRNVSLAVLECAAKAGLETLDLFDPLEKVIAAKGVTSVYPPTSEHHNPGGNRFAAEQIAAKIATMK